MCGAFCQKRRVSAYESPAHQRQPPREGLHLYRPVPDRRGAERQRHRDRDPERRHKAGRRLHRLAYAGGKYLAYKPAAICASARRAGTTTTLDQLVKYPEFFHMPLVSGSYWPMVHGSKPEQVLEDEEGCAVMR